MVSAELLGGAPLPPMTPAQRQQYIDGITIKAKVGVEFALGAGGGRADAPHACGWCRLQCTLQLQRKLQPLLLLWLCFATATVPL